MIIANNKSHKENLVTSTRKDSRFPDGMVVPEIQIISLVGNLLVKDLDIFVQRMQLIVETTCETASILDLKGTETLIKERLSRSDLQTIKQVAREVKGEPHERVMEAILEAVRQGREGIRAANRTAAFAVKVLSCWSCDYDRTLWAYESRLSGGRIKRMARKRGAAGGERGRQS